MVLRHLVVYISYPRQRQRFGLDRHLWFRFRLRSITSTPFSEDPPRAQALAYTAKKDYLNRCPNCELTYMESNHYTKLRGWGPACLLT